MEKLLKIITAPNKKLSKKAQKVINFDQKLNDFAQNMLYTMMQNNGCGLASIQVEDNKDFIYKETEEYRAQPDIFIIFSDNTPSFIVNAKIIEYSNEIVKMVEGCLSIPNENIDMKISRSVSIKVKYQTLTGENIETELHEMKARIFQHEYDHNQGIIFPQRLNKLEENLFWTKYLKKRKYY